MRMEDSATVKESLLRELVKSRVAMRAAVRGAKQGFLIVIQVGGTEKTLKTARGKARLFASLDTAAAFIKELGLPQFEVDMAGFQPGRLRSARPDRAEALKHTRTRMKQQVLGI